MARSCAFAFRSSWRTRCICARRRRFSTFSAKVAENWQLGSASSASGVQETPRDSVSSASRSGLSSRQSSRAVARSPRRLISRIVSSTPLDSTRSTASGKSPERDSLRCSRTRSLGSRSMASNTGAVMRPVSRDMRMLSRRVSFSRSTIRPMSEPNSASCWAMSSSTPFTSAGHTAEAEKKVATPAVFSMSRYSRMLMLRHQYSSFFRSWPSLKAEIVLAIIFRQARESTLARAHCAVA
mmetsp:Transcript_48476/g.128654  ORF Transcript_48476/g.128654 Transcript_48476/m.128654 type:complete len:239 (-) Transcript_48476:605-1321(-)